MSIYFLGIEGGGTRTVALVADATGAQQGRLELGCGNVRLLPDSLLRQLFEQASALCPAPQGIGIGLAGARTHADRARIREMALQVWGAVPVAATHDLEIALRAGGSPTGQAAASVLVLSGTGSCCYGRSANAEARAGGWGHLLGDRASGYHISMTALRAVIFAYDRHGRWGPLGQEILRLLQLNEPEDLIAWMQGANKAEIARLAPVVFASPEKIARQVLHGAAEMLAEDAVICARRLARKTQPVRFLLAGSVLLKQPDFRRKVARLIREHWSTAMVGPLEREAAWGAVEMAREAATATGTKTTAGRRGEAPPEPAPAAVQSRQGRIYVPAFDPSLSPTEQRNPNSMHFDTLTTQAMVELMLAEEQNVAAALRQEIRNIAAAVELAARTLQRGSRIFYTGAGTSGRLGVLDASECPPTFRAAPEMVQGIIAGGQRALWQAVEGAEDDPEAGARAVRARGVKRGDLVLGIAASGRTPFVWGTLAAARALKARTVLVCFNPSLVIERAHRPEVVIAPNLGPEILTGSTRLKCGTATKLILNMISTIAMARLGKVIGNLMVDLNPSNVKLRDRAIRIIRELTGCDPEQARAALVRNDWVVKQAWMELKKRRP